MMMMIITLCRGKVPWGIRIWAQLELGTFFAIFTNSKLNLCGPYTFHIIDKKSALNMVTDDDILFRAKGAEISGYRFAAVTTYLMYT
jgi:hypothetical protein